MWIIDFNYSLGNGNSGLQFTPELMTWNVQLNVAYGDNNNRSAMNIDKYLYI